MTGQESIEWAKEYRSGKSTHRIAADHGISQTRVWTALHRLKLTTRRPSQYDRLHDRENEVIAHFRKTNRYKDTAKVFGVRPAVLSKFLSDRGIRRKTNNLPPEVQIGCIGPLFRDLPDSDRATLIAEASRRRKTIAAILIEDWDPAR